MLCGGKAYACGNCRTHLAGAEDVVSKNFHSRSGKAYLFKTAYNITDGPHEQRMMTTGKHIVCDIFCIECMSCVGWQYILAYEESQKYKEGMCILERAAVVDFDKTAEAALKSQGSLSSNDSSAARIGSAGSSGVLFAECDSGSDDEDEEQ